MYEVIDTLDGNAVVDTFPTARKARNATNRIEPSPEGRKLGYRSITGETRGWRYLVRRKAAPKDIHAATAQALFGKVDQDTRARAKVIRHQEAYGAGDIAIGRTSGHYPNASALVVAL